MIEDRVETIVLPALCPAEFRIPLRDHSLIQSCDLLPGINRCGVKNVDIVVRGIEYEGALYHVLSKGNERREMFIAGKEG